MENQERYRLIPINDGFLLVDDKAEIEIAKDWITNVYKQVYPAKEVIDWEQKVNSLPTKIIAGTYHIGTLPLISNGTDELIGMCEYQQIENLAKNHVNQPWSVNLQSSRYELQKCFEDGFKSNKAIYNEEDMRKAYSEGGFSNDKALAVPINDLLRSIKFRKLKEHYVELEMTPEGTATAILSGYIREPKISNNNTIRIIKLF